MAEGKIRDKNHIIEAKSLLFLQNLFPNEWVQRKMDPDYGIDIDLELFDYENNVCVTLGEHIFLQVKGTESLESATIEPIGKQLYTKKELSKMQISVKKFAIDVSLLRLVERMGSALPVLLVVVDLKEGIAYYVCLNDYARNVLPYRTRDYKCQDSVTIYIPEENVLKAGVASWYGKRAKLYGLLQELLTLADDVRLYNEDHKANAVKRRLTIIADSDAWSVCKYWSGLEELQKELKIMLEKNMINESGEHLLKRLVKNGDDPASQLGYYGINPLPISALVAAQAVSCDDFLDKAKALSALFENQLRHIGLPTQVNWMRKHYNDI